MINFLNNTIRRPWTEKISLKNNIILLGVLKGKADKCINAPYEKNVKKYFNKNNGFIGEITMKNTH